MHKTLLLALALAALAGCERSNPDEVLSRTTKTFVMTRFDPPKHVRADFTEVGSGARYTGVWLGKHCSRPHPKVGQTFQLTEVVRRGQGERGVYYTIEGYRSICQ